MKVREIKVSYSKSGVKNVFVNCSKTVYKVAITHWDLGIIEYQEEVKVLLLNRANMVLGIYDVSKGGTASCSVDIKVILAVALKSNAHSIVLLHNHPSGNLKPSESDKRLTEKLKEACKMVDLVLLDHLIISIDNHYSFADNGVII
jgi:DNA repair protein RadC